MSLGTILIIILILMLVGVPPTWPHSREWGYGPSGVIGTVVLILIVLFCWVDCDQHGRRTSAAISREKRAAYGEIKQGAKHLEKSIGEIRKGLRKAERQIEADARARVRELRTDARASSPS